MKLMTFDVGGTEIKYAIVDDQFQIHNEGSTPTPDNEHTINDFLDLIENIYREMGQDCEGIAMSLPGFINTKEGTQNGGGALYYLHHQPVGPLIQERCGCPVHLENDGKSAAIAELGAGVLKGCENAAVFIIGTGVGGGVITQGKLLRGRDFTAGEFSFLDVNTTTDDPKSYSMQTNYCSTPALIDYYNQKAELKVDNGREFFKLYNEGDETANEALHWFGRNIAVQIVNLGVLINAEKVAIGGGISKQPALVEVIKEEINKLTSVAIMKRFGAAGMVPEVVNCAYSSEANLIGAFVSYTDELVDNA